ncbi:MAG TPA: 1,4-dihydroxy-2-naphthoate polyprenyltransferase, partial [Acidimicrobiales bacterium]|nr:1,4-dihydroxy-2-naphthoate polyprenyltransferase [Acidimicrobiales bacterium]
MTSPWVDGARPKTLPAAIVPVAVGTAVAFSQGEVVWWRALAALVVSLAVQIGTNFANDYSDGIRGTDDVRVGPVRLVASGLKPAAAVKRAAFLSFGVAALAGLALAAATTWWLIPLGGACFAAGWFYTGGPRPYGYAGLGEVFVFVFFGIVATAGSAFVHVEGVTMLAIGASIPVGALATALLVVNNLRDIPT